MIPIDDGSQESILSLGPHESRKALGMEDYPAGGNATQLEAIKTKVGDWINRTKNGHLPAKWAWVTYKHQLWPNKVWNRHLDKRYGRS